MQVSFESIQIKLLLYFVNFKAKNKKKKSLDFKMSFS